MLSIEFISRQHSSKLQKVTKLYFTFDISSLVWLEQ